MSVSIPRNTFEFKMGALPRSRSSNFHFEGGGFSWRDKIGLFWTRGPNENDGEVYMSYSTDGGLNWEEPKLEITKALTGSQSHAAQIQMVYSDRWALYVKGENDEPHRLWTRPIPRYEVREVSVRTTANSPVVEFDWGKHGFQGNGGSNADKIEIEKFIDASGSDELNGISKSNLSGVKALTYVSTTKFSVTASKSAAKGGTATMYLGIRVLDAPWVEVKYGASDFEAAMRAGTGLSEISVLHGYWTSTSDDIVVPVSGNQKCLCRIPNPQNGTAGAFEKRGVFARGSGPAGGYLSGPTIWGRPAPNNGQMFGFLRTQGNPVENLSQKPEFWYSLDGGATIVQSAIKEKIATRCPIPCALGDDDKIYAFCCERLTAHTGDAQVKPAYLLVANRADAMATGVGKGGDAFTIYNVGEVDVLAMAGNFPDVSSEASSTGLPTAVKHGSWIYFFYEEEETPAFHDSTSKPLDSVWSNIKYLAVNTRPGLTQYPAAKRGAM